MTASYCYDCDLYIEIHCRRHLWYSTLTQIIYMLQILLIIGTERSSNCDDKSQRLDGTPRSTPLKRDPITIIKVDAE